VRQLYDEMFRRWEVSPTPGTRHAAPGFRNPRGMAALTPVLAGKGAIEALLQRVSSPEDAQLAADAVERCGAAVAGRRELIRRRRRMC